MNLSYTVGQLRALGVTVAGLPDAAEAGLYRMDGDAGAEYWVGLHNFYVITRYNHSSMYALAVHQLGQAIATRAAEVAMAEAASSDDGACARCASENRRDCAAVARSVFDGADRAIATTRRVIRRT